VERALTVHEVDGHALPASDDDARCLTRSSAAAREQPVHAGDRLPGRVPAMGTGMSVADVIHAGEAGPRSSPQRLCDRVIHGGHEPGGPAAEAPPLQDPLHDLRAGAVVEALGPSSARADNARLDAGYAAVDGNEVETGHGHSLAALAGLRA